MTRRYMLDAGPAYDLLFKRRGVAERIKSLRAAGFKIGIGLPTVGEIIAGLEGSDDREHYWDIAHRNLGQLKFWPFEETAAYQYGALFADLKSRGRVIQQIDMQLAAIAMTLPNCTFATYDSDFDVVPGLRYENWRT
jgi:tRNA(fMet)-specific endonuclease VapC